MEEKNYFVKLNSIWCKTDEKNWLTYVSWADAWAELKKIHADAKFVIYENSEWLPYFETKFWIYCKVWVTVNDIEHISILPVMDWANKIMKSEWYEYSTKWGKKSVAPADLFDINKTIQRAFAKAIALHWIWLYVYRGEDLPEDLPDDYDKTPIAPKEEILEQSKEKMKKATVAKVNPKVEEAKAVVKESEEKIKELKEEILPVAPKEDIKTEKIDTLARTKELVKLGFRFKKDWYSRDIDWQEERIDLVAINKTPNEDWVEYMKWLTMSLEDVTEVFWWEDKLKELKELFKKACEVRWLKGLPEDVMKASIKKKYWIDTIEELTEEQILDSIAGVKKLIW